MTNPLLSDWTTDFALPPFGAITDADFAPAFDAALAEGRARIAAIADNPDAPSYANTIEALNRPTGCWTAWRGFSTTCPGPTAPPRARR